MSVYCPQEMREVLLRLELFRGLDEYELVRLLSAAELMECSEGDYPICEGTQGHHLFVLLTGQARISKRIPGGQKTIHLLHPGECFGEMSLIECRSRSASVRAMTRCKMLKIDGDDIAALTQISAKIYRNIAMLLSRRLRHANELITLG